MRNRRPAHHKFAKKRLHVTNGGLAFVPGGRVAHMPDRQRPGQGFHHVMAGEIVTDIAHAPGRIEPGIGVIGDDPARLLAAMLQRVQPEGHEIGGIGHADHPENPAFLVQFVIIERGAHVDQGMGHEF